MALTTEICAEEPASTIQRQLDAYNAKDLEGLLTIYAEDAQMFEYPATLAATGTAALRQRFAGRFQEPNLHAQLLNRIVMGNMVIDHELGHAHLCRRHRNN